MGISSFFHCLYSDPRILRLCIKVVVLRAIDELYGVGLESVLAALSDLWEKNTCLLFRIRIFDAKNFA